MNPLTILREAIRAVPSIKYALAAAGVLATLSIGMRLSQNDWRVALIGSVGTIVLMTVLVVFAHLSTSAANNFRGPALFLTWSSVALLIFWAVALTTSVFGGWPLKLSGVVAFLDPGTSECTLAPSAKTETVREKTAGDILAQMKTVSAFRKQAVFKNLYERRYIPLGGWIVKVTALPDVDDKKICTFMVVEDATGASVHVNTCQECTAFRAGDKLKLSGWLNGFADEQIDIVANKIDEPPSVAPQTPPVHSAEFIVCHGERETRCQQHPYSRFEHCGNDNGVGGADGKLSGQRLCGNDNFDLQPADGGSISGDHCGYSWFKVACR